MCMYLCITCLCIFACVWVYKCVYTDLYVCEYMSDMPDTKSIWEAESFAFIVEDFETSPPCFLPVWLKVLQCAVSLSLGENGNCDNSSFQSRGLIEDPCSRVERQGTVGGVQCLSRFHHPSCADGKWGSPARLYAGFNWALLQLDRFSTFPAPCDPFKQCFKSWWLPTRRSFLWLLHVAIFVPVSMFATGVNCNANSFGDRGLPRGSRPTGWETLS